MTSSPIHFSELGLPEDLLEQVVQLGYEAPTPIQAQAIPAMLTNIDLVCQAATGTGKTAAFALPIITKLAESGSASGLPSALILAPTRELCVQVAEAVHRYGKPYRLHTLPVYGGAPIVRQISALRRGVDIVVATPGRALDLIKRGSLVLDNVDTLVLDEADEMLDMGFADELDEILSQVPEHRQTVMFSATMPKRIRKIADKHLRSPRTIEIARAKVSEGERPAIEQQVYLVPRGYKLAALGRILDVMSPTATLIFCRTRAEVDELTEALNARGYRAEGLHGGLDQPQRDRVMGRLRSQKTEIVVATDVAARGLDVDHLSHMVNYDVPAAPESYVHRTGRVGRGGRSGIAITIAEPREQRLLSQIEKSTRQQIPVLPVPSSDELRERRLRATFSRLISHTGDDDLDAYRPLLAELELEAAPDLVTLAAIKMAHLATAGDAGEDEIPQMSAGFGTRSRGSKPGRQERSAAHERNDRGRGRTDDTRQEGSRFERGSRDRDDNGSRDHSGGRDYSDRRFGDKRRSAVGEPGKGKTRLFISAGSAVGVRPGDIVGAIANETGLSGKQIGPINLEANFATVDVPSEAAREVISTLNKSRLKGQRVKVRKDRNR